MTAVWCVRAEFGKYTDHFLRGGYVGIGYRLDEDLSGVASREELYETFKKYFPEETSNIVIGQQVGQISRFLLDIKAGDYVITPAMDTEWLHYGKVADEPSYYFSDTADGCPYRQRRKVQWSTSRLRRSDLSVPFQNTMRSSLTVFAVSQGAEFSELIGHADLVPKPAATEYDAQRVVLEQILELDDKEFEILIGHLLTALGFEGSEVTGKSGDGGVDAKGELNLSGMAKVKLFVQAKRYKLGSRVSATTVKALRQAIPRDGQGAFITTADFDARVPEIATDPDFPRIGLINGRQLVDLLVEHWDDIPQEFRERLGLKPGLVRT